MTTGQFRRDAGRTYWHDTVPPEAEARVLEGAVNADFAVIGAGFAGLATAYFLKRADPAVRIVIIDAQRFAAGASGSAGGFVTTRFGLGLATTAAVFGRDRARQAHLYMEQAVELVERLVKQNRLDCDYARTGLLRAATTPDFERKLRAELDLARRMGLRGLDWLDARAVRQQVNSPLFQGGWWEPRGAVLNPLKLMLGMREVLERSGVQIFEQTPATAIQRKIGRLFVRTPKGGIVAEKVAVTTNAFSHLGPLPQLRRRQVPVFMHAMASEPLRQDQLDTLAWERQQAVEDARNLPRFYRLTPDGRLIVGGRDVSLSFGLAMDRGPSPAIYGELANDVRVTFPALRKVRFTHRWGGPVSVPMQMIPALGHLGSERIVYALGCMGHGIALSHMNGWTLSDLLRGERTERTEAFFVNRKVLAWPPEPLRLGLTLALRGLARVEDAWHERMLPEAPVEPPVPLASRELEPAPRTRPAVNGK